VSKSNHGRKGVAVSLVLCAALGACSAASPGAEFNDPYENLNRQVHEFNKAVDSAILRPAGRATAQLPAGLTAPVINFSDNASLPGMIVNGALQADVEGVATNTFRFLINSSVGVLGLVDVAGTIGLREKSTDFGQTLAVWGVPEGAFLELPGFGPSNERDAVGIVVDFLIDPLETVGLQAQKDYGTPTWVGEQVIERGMIGDTIDSVLYESADSYAQTRLIYLQNRRFELGQGAGGGNVAYDDAYYFDPYEDQQ
jgi:phospholipid-binding lipoprotein MlaA